MWFHVALEYCNNRFYWSGQGLQVLFEAAFSTKAGSMEPCYFGDLTLFGSVSNKLISSSSEQRQAEGVLYLLLICASIESNAYPEEYFCCVCVKGLHPNSFVRCNTYNGCSHLKTCLDLALRCSRASDERYCDFSISVISVIAIFKSLCCCYCNRN